MLNLKLPDTFITDQTQRASKGISSHLGAESKVEYKMLTWDDGCNKNDKREHTLPLIFVGFNERSFCAPTA